MSDLKVFEYMEKHKYEQVVYFYDRTTGLKGVTVIHNTTLGPALGGTRLWNYESEDAAVLDCLRLARGMTYKAAAAGLNLGGGKTVLIGDATKVKSEAYFRALGRYVQALNGRYITAEDVNTNTKDMSYIHMETDYVVGLEGKSGNPSPMTALGGFYGVKAALKYKFGCEDVSKYTYAVQGAGQTGYYLIKYLLEAGAKKIYFSELNPKHIERMKNEHPEVEFVDPDKIYSMDVDVFSPCALGGVLNSDTIPKIKAKVIAGTANNVLLEEDIHGDMIKDQGILYAPDFVINAGGLINVYYELLNQPKEKVEADLKLIYDRLLEIFEIADRENIHTQLAAKVFAKNRIETIKNLHDNYIPR
ncbi:MAG: Glu/Leu/Phe/Val dehydrogenase dimerization domain-containing protein [Acholeplasma sp.]|jgi:leucine dehydrogenase|nr:Glu/Leu/Phe/Val dehydrogenase dimerization domain-containing protein [Acholeplasma sp.]